MDPDCFIYINKGIFITEITEKDVKKFCFLKNFNYYLYM